MGKYESCTALLAGLFATPEWKATKVKTQMGGASSSPEIETVCIAILHNGTGLNLKSVSGLLIADIFTPIGRGPLRALQIADLLDKLLVGKSLTSTEGTAQIARSTLGYLGVDAAQKSLQRHKYTVPFQFYGVT